MKRHVRIIFYLKKPRNYYTGPVPIYLRITVAGKRAEISTGRECEPRRWSPAAGRSTGNKEAVLSLNSYLDTLQAKVHEAHHQLLDAGEPVSSERIKAKYLGKQEKERKLLEEMQEHNRRMEFLVGKEYTPSTLKGHKTSLGHTRDFIKWKYSTGDIDIRKVDHAFVTDYDFYLRSICSCSNNSTLKYIKQFKKVIRQCLHQGWIERDPFLYYKAKVKQIERVYLSEEELEKIAAKELVTERLSQVRDIFLFCCFTGLAYADVQRLSRSDVLKGVDGEDWVFIKRQKTDIPTRTPLLPSAKVLLDRYKEHSQCLYNNRLLPVLSNQKMNA